MDPEIMTAPESELLHRIATLEAENARLRARLGEPAKRERGEGWWTVHRTFCSGIGCPRCAELEAA